MIVDLLNDKKFGKNLRMIVYFFPIVLELFGDRALAGQLLEYARTQINRSINGNVGEHGLFGDFFRIDIEFQLLFYHKKLRESQLENRDTDYKRIIVDLNKINEREEALSLLLHNFYDQLSKGFVNNKERKLIRILLSISKNIHFCDNTYERIIKIYPSYITFSRYGNYLLKYKNDVRNGRIFFKQADLFGSEMVSNISGSNDALQALKYSDKPILFPIRSSEDNREIIGSKLNSSTLGVNKKAEDENEEEKDDGKESRNEEENEEEEENEDKEESENGFEENNSLALPPIKKRGRKRSWSKPEVTLNEKPMEIQQRYSFGNTTEKMSSKKKPPLSIKTKFPSKKKEERESQKSVEKVFSRFSSSMTSNNDSKKNNTEIKEIKVTPLRKTRTTVVRDFSKKKNRISSKHIPTTGKVYFSHLMQTGVEEGLAKLHKKIGNTTTIIQFLFDLFVFLFFFVSCLSIIICFSLFAYFSISFSSISLGLENVNKIQHEMGIVNSLLVNEKISQYYNSTVDLLDEEDEEDDLTWKESIQEKCNNIQEYLDEAYFDSWCTKNFLSSEIINISDVFFYRNKSSYNASDWDYDNNEKIISGEEVEYVIIDTATMFAEKCQNLVDAITGKGDPSTFTNDNYYWMIKNFFSIRKGFAVALEEYQASTKRRDASYIIFSVLVLLNLIFLIFFVVLIGVYKKKMWKSVRAFTLIPLTEILNLKEKYKKDIIRNGKDLTSTVNSKSGTGSQLSTKFQNSYSQVSKKSSLTLSEMFLVVIITFIISIIIILCSSILLHILCDTGFYNNSFNYLTNLQEMETGSRSLYLLNTELYIYDSFDKKLFESREEIKNFLKEEKEELLTNYDNVRFAFTDIDIQAESSYLGEESNLEDFSLNNFYVRDESESCKNDYESLICRSVNYIVNYLYQDSVISDETSNLSNETLQLIQLEKNNYLKELYVLTFSSNGIEEKISLLFSQIKQKYSNILETIYNAAIACSVILLPIFFMSFIFVLLRFRNQFNSSLLIGKQVMLLCDYQMVIKQNIEILDYIVDKGTLSKCTETKRQRSFKNNLTTIKELGYGFLIFEKDFDILYYNNEAEEMFNLSDDFKLEDIIDKEGIKIIKDWMGRKTNEDEHEQINKIFEVNGFYDKSDKFPVSLNLTKCNRDSTSDFLFKGKYGSAIGFHKKKTLYSAIVENILSSKKKKILEEAEKRSEQIEILLKNIFPSEIAEKMKIEDIGKSIVSVHKSVSAIFMDIVGFTSMCKSIGDIEIIQLLHKLFTGIDKITLRHSCTKIKTIGDAYFTVVGIPKYKPLASQIAMQYSIEVLEFLKNNFPQINCRFGISSGKAVTGVIGKYKVQYDVFGKTVVTAALMEKHGVPGKIQVSRETYELVFENYNFIKRKIETNKNERLVCYLYTPDNGKK